jgi:hypothetical protein
MHDIGRKFDVLFSRLTKRFADVQFFGSYRVVSFVAWAPQRERGGAAQAHTQSVVLSACNTAAGDKPGTEALPR